MSAYAMARHFVRRARGAAHAGDLKTFAIWMQNARIWRDMARERRGHR